MTYEKNTTTGSPYAPWDLRRLPNFDFSEYLRKVEKPDGKGQTVEMTLEGTKRWFRLACPNGGLVLNPLRVADTMRPGCLPTRATAIRWPASPPPKGRARPRGTPISAPPRTLRWKGH